MTNPELTAGPETDALVAEAMGWTWLPPYELQVGIVTHRYPHEGAWKTGSHDDGAPIWRRVRDWKPTTGDGMLAMMEWMQADPRGWAIAMTVDKTSAAVMVFPRNNSHDLARGDADTAPLAVAKALLAAVEKESQT